MIEPKIKILLVDDELSFGRLMKRILEDNGYSCTAVTSGAAALESLRLESFDLVMTDINMPEMDGLTLIEKIVPQYPELAIIVTTGVSCRDVAFKALQLGAYGYVLKPCDEFELLIQLKNALRRLELESITRAYRQELEILVAQRTTELELANRSLKETNQLLRQQEKLAAIGQLAAGIAHEIKTPTGFVASNLKSLQKYQRHMLKYVDVLQRRFADVASCEQQAEIKALAKELKIDWICDDTVDLVNNCLEGTARIKEISEGLKSFSRHGSENEEPFELNQVLEDSLLLVGNELKYKAEVRLRMQKVPMLMGFRQRLEQVFINLFVNASHAIKEKGIIEVSTFMEEDYVVARIADNGCGISPEHLERIFEPFYTTKDIGVGTGLGLSIIKNIIDEHRGRIEVESTVGTGTTFTLWLPVTVI